MRKFASRPSSARSLFRMSQRYLGGPPRRARRNALEKRARNLEKQSRSLGKRMAGVLAPEGRGTARRAAVSEVRKSTHTGRPTGKLSNLWRRAARLSRGGGGRDYTTTTTETKTVS